MMEWEDIELPTVQFSHSYIPHNCPIYYHNQPIELTPEQEQVWNIFACSTLSKDITPLLLPYLNKVMEGVVQIDDLDALDVHHIRKTVKSDSPTTITNTAIAQGRIRSIMYHNPFYPSFYKNEEGELELPVGLHFMKEIIITIIIIIIIIISVIIVIIIHNSSFIIHHS